MGYLFSDNEIQFFIDNNKRNLFAELDGLSDTAILSRSDEEWLGHFKDQYTLSVPILDINRADRTYADGLVPKYRVPNPNFDNQPGVPGRIHTLHVPYSGLEIFFSYRPSTYHMASVAAGTSNSEVTITVGGDWYTKESIEDHFDLCVPKTSSRLIK